MSVFDDDLGASAVMAGECDGLVGQHLLYEYGNGWRYELYVKNGTTIDYRIHTGMVGGRWVKDQAVILARLDEDWFTCSWSEPTGTSVSLTICPARRRLHGAIFFPRWVEQHPERTVVYQNERLDEMRALRDAGPAYPIAVVDETARIFFVEDRGLDDESVIGCAPHDLAPGYATRRN
ncbi:phenolic acid decarboxylase [Amycolatopsis sp. GM8]|uniref:phenolic acid decarboxylase n=1 Tax=Amycolatopsis sp. GM8 TaxID=2896530 RepID=UPI001F457D62|nr:phenolic acid decarboxylase [Amycolatopsis sp. GM8]